MSSILTNNEALGVLALHSVLSNSDRLFLANVYFALPLLFDLKIRNYLKRKTTKIISAQQLISSKDEIFVGFNDKYNDCLLTTTNSILMGVESGVFTLKEGYLSAIKSFDENPKQSIKKINDIVSASVNTSRLLEEPPKVLSSLLRIKL